MSVEKRLEQKQVLLNKADKKLQTLKFINEFPGAIRKQETIVAKLEKAVANLESKLENVKC